MVMATFRVVHEHCALCGQGDRSLFVLNLTGPDGPRLEPKADGLHTGICRACWWKVRLALGEDA